MSASWVMTGKPRWVDGAFTYFQRRCQGPRRCWGMCDHQLCRLGPAGAGHYGEGGHGWGSNRSPAVKAATRKLLRFPEGPLGGLVLSALADSLSIYFDQIADPKATPAQRAEAERELEKLRLAGVGRDP